MTNTSTPLFPLPPLSQEALDRTSEQFELPHETILELISSRPENIRKRKLDRLKNEANVASLQFKEQAKKHEQHIGSARLHCACKIEELERIARYKHKKAYHFRTRNYIRPLLNEHLHVKDVVSIIVSYLTNTIKFNDGFEDKMKRDEQRAPSAAQVVSETVTAKTETAKETESHEDEANSEHLSPSHPLSQHTPCNDDVDSTAKGPGWRALYNDPDNLAYVAMQRNWATQQIASSVAHAIQFPFDRQAARRNREQAAEERAKRVKFINDKFRFTANDLAERITECTAGKHKGNTLSLKD